MSKSKFNVGDGVFVRSQFQTADGRTLLKGQRLKVESLGGDGICNCLPFSLPSFERVKPFAVPSSRLSRN